MKNYDLYVGIDVSSKTIDVVTSEGQYQKLTNDLKGFKELKKNSLVAKGKSKKLALIAVGNKLIKQMFGLVRNGAMYDETHVSVHSPK